MFYSWANFYGNSPNFLIGWVASLFLFLKPSHYFIHQRRSWTTFINSQLTKHLLQCFKMRVFYWKSFFVDNWAWTWKNFRQNFFIVILSAQKVFWFYYTSCVFFGAGGNFYCLDFIRNTFALVKRLSSVWYYTLPAYLGAFDTV